MAIDKPFDDDRSLREQIEWNDSVSEGYKDYKYYEPKEADEVETAEVIQDEVIVNKPSDIDPRQIQALSFVDKLIDGKSVTKAARETGASVYTLMNNPLVQQRLKEWHGSATQRKNATLAALMEIVFGDDKKQAVAAAKLLLQDPELGWQNPTPTTATQINIGNDTLEILRKAPKLEGTE